MKKPSKKQPSKVLDIAALERAEQITADYLPPENFWWFGAMSGWPESDDGVAMHAQARELIKDMVRNNDAQGAIEWCFVEIMHLQAQVRALAKLVDGAKQHIRRGVHCSGEKSRRKKEDKVQQRYVDIRAWLARERKKEAQRPESERATDGEILALGATHFHCSLSTILRAEGKKRGNKGHTD